MEKSENKFLGEMPVKKLLIKFAVPCVLSMVITALYNIVDQIFIGNYPALGFLGNAATTVVFPITVITMAFSWAIGDGNAAFMSICQGRKDTKKSHRSVGNSLLVNLIISLIFVLVCSVFMTPVLNLFGATPEIIDLCRDYFTIILAFVPIFTIGNILGSVARADGAPAYSMIMTVAGALTNIILDPIFIFGFNWSIKGAAWATVIGQTLTFVLGIIYLFRSKTFKLRLESFRLEASVFGNVIKLGVSTFITQMAIVITAMVANLGLAKWGAVSEVGAEIPMAVMGIAVKVLTILINISAGIIVGAQPILGYNIGAGLYGRVRETFRRAITAVLVVCIIGTLLIEINPDFIISLFGSNSETYMQFARFGFRSYLLGIALGCSVKVISIFFQAVGQPLKATITSLSRDIIFLIPLMLILPNFIGVSGIFWAAPIADLLGIIVSVAFIIPFFRRLPQQSDAPAKSGSFQDSRPGIIITISRQHGSQGKKIGELVAKQLGIPYYYKELTALIAEESGITDQYIDKVNSNDGSNAVSELYLTTSPAKYAIEAQDAVIKEIAKRGSCVIVGRAADYALQGHKNLLRVFIYAPKEFRIKNVMSMYKDNRKAAIKHIDRADHARAEYYELISGQKWGDVENYDLCIDASMGKEKVAALIADFAKSAE